MAAIIKKFNVELVLIIGEVVVSRLLYSAATSCLESPDEVSELLTLSQIVAGNSDTALLIEHVKRIGSPNLPAPLPNNTSSEFQHIGSTKIKLDLVSAGNVFDVEFDSETGIFNFNRSSFSKLPFTALQFTTQEITDFILHVRNVFGI